MTLLLRTTICACMGLILSACSFSSSTNQFADLQYVVVKDDPSGKWGIASPDGKYVAENMFDNCPSAPVGGIFAVLEDEGYTAYRIANGKIAPIENCCSLVSVGRVGDGLMPICRRNSRIEVIDPSGLTTFSLSPINGKEVVECLAYYSDGLLPVKTSDGLWGAISVDGTTVIEPKFNRLTNFRNGYAFATINALGSDVDMLIDKQGTPVVTFKPGWKLLCEDLAEQIFAVRTAEGKVLLVRTDGVESVAPSFVRGILAIHSPQIIYISDEGFCGLMSLPDFTVQLAARPQQQSLAFLPWSNDLLALDAGSGTYCCISPNGNEGTSWSEYKTMMPLQMKKFSGYLAYDNNAYVFLDKDGNVPEHTLRAYDISLSSTVSATLISDYVNYDEISAKVASLIGVDNLDKVKIGENPLTLYSNQMMARNYTFERTFDYEAGSYSNSRCDITCLVTAEKPLGIEKMKTWPDTIVSYSFDAHNKVNQVKLVITDPTNVAPDFELPRTTLWDNCAIGIAKAIAAKGFAQISETDSVQCFANDSLLYSLRYNPTHGSIILTLNKNTK